ncbi:hypothetical protein GCM10010967_18900 [Dyadobacter beijingensis]|uniref:HTH cro/C1-type domain-containing protein n=1 Tax=Dyadobacter beijingensis TaxID=365489 RepID=A0ABQ2HQR6_9BACT|nr:HipA domain-containing protein [Dyadobacter beijingensis]GGM86744.1 hypothetical protein GCM10010967_18900 [Dyadobacter beijingensis]
MTQLPRYVKEKRKSVGLTQEQMALKAGVGCQWSELLTEQKYKGSYEKVGKLIRQYCTHKGLDSLAFFELVLFSFLTGNNDMYLKNFSVVHDNGEIKLAPAYDLLNVNLVFLTS